MKADAPREFAYSSRNLPVRVVVVVFPSLPVTAKLLAPEKSRRSSISEVTSAPRARAVCNPSISGRIPGERKIISSSILSKQVSPDTKRTPFSTSAKALSPSSAGAFLSLMTTVSPIFERSSAIGRLETPSPKKPTLLPFI